MIIMEEAQLPDKLSGCLEVALGDLERCEKDDEYIINMQVWHDPDQDVEGCSVCFAGSVMAKTLETNSIYYKTPGSFNKHNKFRLRALDLLRHGHIINAVSIFMEDTDNLASWVKIPNMVVADYGEDPEGFKRDMKRIIAMLIAEGL